MQWLKQISTKSVSQSSVLPFLNCMTQSKSPNLSSLLHNMNYSIYTACDLELGEAREVMDAKEFYKLQAATQR